MKRAIYLSVVTVLLLAHSVVMAAEKSTILDRYIAKKDNCYSYDHYKTDKNFFYRTYFLSMASQCWREDHEVDRTLWEHEVSITVPINVRFQRKGMAIVIVDGGSNRKSLQVDIQDGIALLSLVTQSVIVVVRQVPNQPLQFLDENPPRMRKEDEILAYSMDHFLSSCNKDASECDWEWPVHLAMTKAVVKAMDTVQTL